MSRDHLMGGVTENRFSKKDTSTNAPPKKVASPIFSKSTSVNKRHHGAPRVNNRVIMTCAITNSGSVVWGVLYEVVKFPDSGFL